MTGRSSRALLPAVAVAAAVLVAGCGGAREAQQAAATSPTRQHVDTADGRVGSLRMTASIASPPAYGATYSPGGTVDLWLSVANDGTAADELTGAGSPAAAQVVHRVGEGPPSAQVRVPVPAGGVAALRTPEGPHLELDQLTQPLHSGQSVPVTFTFRDAGPVTLQVPVETYAQVKPTTSSPPGG